METLFTILVVVLILIGVVLLVTMIVGSAFAIKIIKKVLKDRL